MTTYFYKLAAIRRFDLACNFMVPMNFCANMDNSVCEGGPKRMAA